MERIVHKLQPGATIQLAVHARDRYSRNALSVQAGETYHVQYLGGQWIDLLIPATATGYKNPLANLVGQRVKDTNCFCLCGTYNDSEGNAFAIGAERTFTISVNGTLSFFANDVPGFDWNNWGMITIAIERTS